MAHSTPKPAIATGGSRESCSYSVKLKNTFPITSPKSAVQQYTVTDGRATVGTAKAAIDGGSVALAPDGTVVGRFQTLQHAMRALPAGRAL
jgi:hypothetical protein